MKKETKIVENRKLYSEDLRNICIKKNWYTRGTNEEYAILLSLADKYGNVKTAAIVNLAEDIKFHSDTEYPVESICFEIAAICRSYFETA